MADQYVFGSDAVIQLSLPIDQTTAGTLGCSGSVEWIHPQLIARGSIQREQIFVAVQAVEYAFYNEGVGRYQPSMARIVAPGLRELVNVVCGDLC